MTSSEVKAPAVEAPQDCVVCLDAEATMIAMPCKHKILCLECSRKLALESEKTTKFGCTICRTEITSVVGNKLIIQTMAESFKTFSDLETKLALSRSAILSLEGKEKSAKQAEIDAAMTEQSSIIASFLEGASRSINAFMKKHPTSRSRKDVGPDLAKFMKKFSALCAKYNQCGLISVEEYSWIGTEISKINRIDEQLSKPALTRDQMLQILYLRQQTAVASALASALKETEK
jgi:hypothetical protein